MVVLCMQSSEMKKLAMIIWAFCQIMPGVYAQERAKLTECRPIGPRGMDTTAFSEIVVFRDSAENYNNYWFSVMIDGMRDPAAIINPGYCNIIRTRKQGEHMLYTKTYAADSLELQLTYGKRCYVMLTVTNVQQRPQTAIRSLAAEEGERRWKEFTGPTMVRYMQLTDQNTDYAADKYPDSLRWRAGNALFHFRRPPFLEIIKSHVALIFHEPDISPTYSEFMTLAESKQKGIKDSASFFRFAEGKGKEKLKEGLHILALTREDMARMDFPNAVIYYVESEDTNAQNKGKDKHLHIRNIVVYFYVPEYNKKNGCYVLILSERGNPSELSTREELLAKFGSIWYSLRVSRE